MKSDSRCPRPRSSRAELLHWLPPTGIGRSCPVESVSFGYLGAVFLPWRMRTMYRRGGPLLLRPPLLPSGGRGNLLKPSVKNRHAGCLAASPLCTAPSRPMSSLPAPGTPRAIDGLVFSSPFLDRPFFYFSKVAQLIGDVAPRAGDEEHISGPQSHHAPSNSSYKDDSPQAKPPNQALSTARNPLPHPGPVR